MADCVGCGFCCNKAPCAVAVRIYGNITKCPDLKWDFDGNRYICRLMTLSGNQGFEYRKELYAGEGCCCGLNSWRGDVKDRGFEAKEQAYSPVIPPIMQLFLGCLSKEFISGDVFYLVLHRMAFKMEADGVHKNEIEKTIKEISHIIKENRSSFSEQFMG